MRKLSLFFLAAAAVSAAAHEMPAPKPSSKELSRVKALAGTWTGSMAGKPGDKVTVVYKVVAAGSAVEEDLFPGTPEEMVSIYYDKGGKLAMTHYCAIGNRPEMRLKKAGVGTLELEAGPETDMHMHALTLEQKGPDQLTQTWVSYKGGKKDETSVFEFSRAQ
jgi:hypothetical protein